MFVVYLYFVRNGFFFYFVNIIERIDWVWIIINSLKDMLVLGVIF